MLEHWAAAIATPSMRHLGIMGPQSMGTQYIRQVIAEFQRLWLAHTSPLTTLLKARAGPRPPWCGPYRSCTSTNRRNGKGCPGPFSTDC